jgi:phosphoribosyl-ATP pyrophosphohydrolase/phosphoribosyl-AMP cyclohydrolase/histidinol dehydrogenase
MPNVNDSTNSAQLQASCFPDRSREELLSRQPSGIDGATLSAAGEIVEAVRRGGLTALRAQAERWGDVAPGAPLLLERSALLAALERLPKDQRELLERTAQRIRTFALAQKACLQPLDLAVPGGRAGHDLVPLERVGCYAPGGRFPLPSTVLMTALVAKAAGVEHVTVASPRPPDLVLAAAALADADAFLAVGGAQAIAALAYGVEGLEPVDFICGPGNRFVTAAKQLVFGRMGIDALAGPSELLVIADDSADPGLVAADLLAQAEHDPDAWPVLITTDAALLEAVRRTIAAQLEPLAGDSSTTADPSRDAKAIPATTSALSRERIASTAPLSNGAPAPRASAGAQDPSAANRAIARQSLAQGGAIVVPTLSAAAELANRLAPEHLALFVRDPRQLAASIRHAGALFLGQNSSEVFGDYGFGPNHVLPTGQSARHRGGLSVFDFLRARTWLASDSNQPGLTWQPDTTALADLEGLHFHASASRVRDERPGAD